MKILLLEDDIILNEIIQEHLEESKYDVISVFDGNEAQDYIYSQKFDLFLFDVNVPNIDGFELLNELRSQNIKTPAIFITSLNMADDMQKGFDSGCDDYIKKPFELRELDIRINNIKRIYNIVNQTSMKIDERIIFDKEKLIVKIDNYDIAISKKESEVLEYFVKNANKNISVEELVNNIWTYEETPSDSTIRTYIKNLRKIVGEDKISNTRGVGYRFNKE